MLNKSSMAYHKDKLKKLAEKLISSPLSKARHRHTDSLTRLDRKILKNAEINVGQKIPGYLSRRIAHIVQPCIPETLSSHPLMRRQAGGRFYVELPCDTPCVEAKALGKIKWSLRQNLALEMISRLAQHGIRVQHIHEILSIKIGHSRINHRHVQIFVEVTEK